MRYGGRVFHENERYLSETRTLPGLTSNRVWLYTVDAVTEAESGDKLVQLVRWRARLESGPEPIRYWQRYRTYNIRSAEQWEGASRIVDAYFQKSSELVSDP